VERSFNKFTDAAKEAGKSRIFAGIHWSFDSAAAEQLGRKIGKYVADHYFLPLSSSSGASLQAAPAASASVNGARGGIEVQPLPAEAFTRGQAASFDTSASIDSRSADWGGLTLEQDEETGVTQDTLTAGTPRTVRASLIDALGLLSTDEEIGDIGNGLQGHGKRK
jgi:hypothetical protein